jgi:hypothetical protein
MDAGSGRPDSGLISVTPLGFFGLTRIYGVRVGVFVPESVAAAEWLTCTK